MTLHYYRYHYYRIERAAFDFDTASRFLFLMTFTRRACHFSFAGVDHHITQPVNVSERLMSQLLFDDDGRSPRASVASPAREASNSADAEQGDACSPRARWPTLKRIVAPI